MRNLLVILIGVLLLVGTVSADAYTSAYPPVQSGDYVKATTTFGDAAYPFYATDPTKSLTGSGFSYTAWVSSGAPGTNANQRFHIDLGSAKIISRIYYENFHHEGGETTLGARNFTFWGSNSAESFNTLTYSNNTGWTQITMDAVDFDQHTAADTTDPKYVNTSNTVAYRYYAIKIGNNWGHVTYMGLRRVELQVGSQWSYSSAGTFYWTCPENVTQVYVQLLGGGGSGASAAGSEKGLGGSASTMTAFTHPVTPGVNYTVVVAEGGAAKPPSSSPPSNSGGSSTVFGRTGTGGAGGAREGAVNANGTAGEDSAFGGTGDAEAGGNTSFGEYGGAAGAGIGAGGGGGATHYGGTPGDPTYFGAGGKGSAGMVIITNYDAFGGNIPDFVADITTGNAGTLVHFTDLSVINDATDLTYLWDFGDGTTSEVVGNVMHVYSYTGTYDVSLTINTTSSSVTETKVTYIAIVVTDQDLRLGSAPIPIQLKIVDGYSTPLVAATVSIWYLSSSLPNTSTLWLQSLYDIDASVAAEIINNGYVMSQLTGSDGSMTFSAFPSLGYTVTVTNATIGLNHTVTINANEKDSPYIIHCTLASQQKTNNTLAATSSTWLPWYKVNATAYRLQVNYTDTSGATTNVRFIVMYRNGTQLYNHAQAYTTGTELIDNFTVNNLPLGTELIWKYNATKGGGLPA